MLSEMKQTITAEVNSDIDNKFLHLVLSSLLGENIKMAIKNFDFLVKQMKKIIIITQVKNKILIIEGLIQIKKNYIN